MKNIIKTTVRIARSTASTGRHPLGRGGPSGWYSLGASFQNFLLKFGIQTRFPQTGHRIIRPTNCVGPGKEFRHFRQVTHSSDGRTGIGISLRPTFPGTETCARQPEQITIPLWVG